MRRLFSRLWRAVGLVPREDAVRLSQKTDEVAAAAAALRESLAAIDGALAREEPEVRIHRGPPPR